MTFYSLPLTRAAAPANMRREVDRLVNEVFGASPATDLVETQTRWILTIDMPGVPSDKVEVLTEEGVLTVRGEKPAARATEESRLLLNERRTGTFERRFRLPKMADAASIEASYTDGVLTVSVAKVAPAEPRRISVQIDSGQTRVAQPASERSTEQITEQHDTQ